MGLLDRPQAAQRYGLLSPDVMSLIQSGGPRMAPAPVAPPQRQRVSGLRVLDRVLGGATVTEGLDAERARLRAEALRPQNEARDAFVRAHAMALGPVAEAGLALDPEGYGKAMNSNLEGYTLGAGGYRGGVNGRVATAPTFTTVNDTVYRNDPGTGTSVPTATAPAAFSDMTARYNAENPTVASGATVFNLPTGRVVAQGMVPLDPVSVPQGGLVTPFNRTTGEFGTPVQGNAPVRAVPDAVRRDNEKDQEQIDARELTTARIDNAVALIDQNQINLSPLDRASAWLRNNTGNSSPQSRAQAELRRTVETLRNNILNDATGPQTDGDSLRALNQILNGWGDEQVVRDGLAQYANIQRQKTASQRRIMDGRLAAYGEGGSAPAGSGVSVEAALAELRRRGEIQ